MITYKYQNLTGNGLPRFPVYLRIRSDKSWKEVVADAQKDAAAAGLDAPVAVRQPSLMNEQPGSSSAPPLVRKSSSSLLFTEMPQSAVEDEGAAAAKRMKRAA